MGALEVQNVKRAINRYGTLPKGARIGAYLESLRQSGMPSNQEGGIVGSPLSTAIEQHEFTNPGDILQHRSLSPRQNNLRNQPQMTRSNSSSGVVNTYQPPNSPRSRAIAARKNNSENVGLKTFRVCNTSTFRTASPSRPLQPTLADLEFPPPPPLDLSPLPNESFNVSEQFDLPPPMMISPNSNSSHIKNLGSPIGMRKVKDWKFKEESSEDQEERNTDVRNPEPSVKEASSRFGVSLRRRDAGIETGSKSDEKTSKTSDQTRQRTIDTNLETRMNSVTQQTSPPEESPPPPPPPPPPIIGSGIDAFNSKPGMKEMLELKLINEIKQSSDMKQNNTLKKVSSSNNIASAPLDPASQLLSELCATFSMDSNKQPIQSEYAMANFNPDPSTQQDQDKSGGTKEIIHAVSPIVEGILNPNNTGFKLKKVDKRPQKEESSDSQIIDFKARLRKIDADKSSEEKNKKDDGNNTGESLESIVDEQDDKRRSTGSISSLKKLWENKEATSENQPLSPKLGVRGSNKQDDPGEESPEDHSGASTRSSTSKTESRVWPPPSMEAEKPIVPAKPTKPLISTGKHFASSIYATPNCNKTPQDDDLGKQSDSKGAKNNVIEISTVIENSIVHLKSSPTIVIASWLQLSDKVGLLHGMCVNLTDITIAPHAKFQFRDLLSRLELQARQLRAAGTRNIAENTRLLSDVQNTIKDVINMVQR